MQNRMLLELESRPENVGVARLAVGAFAGTLNFTLAELDEIKVAVSEAVTNCIVHGYGQGSGTVRVEGRISDDELYLSISDQGCGIADIDAARMATFSSDPERMGLGFVFMESFMDNLEVRSTIGEGTTVQMSKRCDRPPAA